ncbi:MAG TPA: hypothetical protein VF738_03710 [Rhodanobacter sp.]
MKRLVIALTASLLATAALGQNAGQPLNLKLPPQRDMPPTDLPAHAGSTARPASSAPGMYYGDTSGSTSHADERSAGLQPCDDSTYNQAQMHGSVGMGVVAGNHASGNYQTGTVSVSKQLGDCDHPSGSVNFSIGVGQGHFHGRGW